MIHDNKVILRQDRSRSAFSSVLFAFSLRKKAIFQGSDSQETADSNMSDEEKNYLESGIICTFADAAEMHNN